MSAASAWRGGIIAEGCGLADLARSVAEIVRGYADGLGDAAAPGCISRIANDQRYPAGIDTLFFDGRARSMQLHEMDLGYPDELDRRLRWFAIMPARWAP